MILSSPLLVYGARRSAPPRPFRMKVVSQTSELARLHAIAGVLLSCMSSEADHTVGVMFALRRKKLLGSYLFLRATSRS